VTAGNGSDTRDILLNPPAWTPSGNTVLRRRERRGDGRLGFVRLVGHSPSPNVGYRVFRSVAPRALQVTAYISRRGAAPVKTIIHFDRRSSAVESASSPRVRSTESQRTWAQRYGRLDYRELHGTNLPPEFIPASRLRINATNGSATSPGRRFCSRREGQEANGTVNWNRPDVSLRRVAATGGLANTAAWATFHQMYRRQAGLLVSAMAEVRLSSRARAAHQRGTACHPRFTGQALWMDNIRLFRFDTPPSAARTVPSRKVFDGHGRRRAEGACCADG
jgi:hypothetical protein